MLWCSVNECFTQFCFVTMTFVRISESFGMPEDEICVKEQYRFARSDCGYERGKPRELMRFCLGYERNGGGENEFDDITALFIEQWQYCSSGYVLVKPSIKMSIAQYVEFRKAMFCIRTFQRMKCSDMMLTCELEGDVPINFYFDSKAMQFLLVQNELENTIPYTIMDMFVNDCFDDYYLPVEESGVDVDTLPKSVPPPRRGRLCPFS